MSRVDRERRQNRKDMGEEILFEPGLIVGAELGRLEKRYADGGQLLAQLAPAALLLDGEKADAVADFGELLRRSQSVLGRRRHALAHLAAQSRDADHEELVKIGRRNRQEAQLLEQRV